MANDDAGNETVEDGEVRVRIDLGRGYEISEQVRASLENLASALAGSEESEVRGFSVGGTGLETLGGLGGGSTGLDMTFGGPLQACGCKRIKCKPTFTMDGNEF